jgi:hypothetical protein
MAAASGSAGRDRIRVFGVDPGSVNMGLAEYDATRGRVISLERVQFRASGTGGNDAGQARLIKSVVAWIRENLPRFHNSVIFIENQPPEAYGHEGQAVQHAFQTIFVDRCIPVLPESVKQRFGKYFPKHPRIKEFDPHRKRANQYAYDKRNAIINGRQFVPAAVREEYERKNPTKKDDAYDAYWIARYGADFMLMEDGSVRDKPKPAPRLKRGEVHPRGRAKRTAKAAPKAKPKPKPKAKAKAKPKARAAPKRSANSKRKKMEQSSGSDTEDTISYSEDESGSSDVVDLTASAPASKRRRRE